MPITGKTSIQFGDDPVVDPDAPAPKGVPGFSSAPASTGFGGGFGASAVTPFGGSSSGFGSTPTTPAAGTSNINYSTSSGPVLTGAGTNAAVGGETLVANTNEDWINKKDRKSTRLNSSHT